MKIRDLFEKPTGLENGDATGMKKVTIPRWSHDAELGAQG